MLSLLVAVTALTGALVPWLLPTREDADPWTLGALLLLAAVSGLRCVKARGKNAWFVPTDAFALAGIVALGGRPACAIALAGVLATTLGAAGKLAAQRSIFNVATVLVATATAAAVFASLGEGVPAFLTAAICLFVVNTGLVAAAVALDRARGWVATWRTTFLPTFPRFAVAAVFGVVLGALASWGSAYMLILGSLPGISGYVTQLLTSSP